MNEEESQFQRNVDEMQVKLKQNKVPYDIQEKIMVYMQFCHKEGVEFNEPNTAFSYLCRTLRKEMLFQEYEKMLSNVPMFAGLDKDEVFEICTHFR